MAEWIRQKVDWERLGLEVAGHASNGRKGLELYSVLRPDIVMTDLRMPVMDGISMIGEIRRLSQKTRILILTCLDEFELARQAIGYDVTSYIMKLQFRIPDIENELVKAVSWLDKNSAAHDAQCGTEDGLPPKLVCALRFIDEHYAENIGICDAADRLNISSSYLGKLFARCELGTFTERLNLRRVQEAKKLLAAGGRIYEVAEQTGFISTSYFIRIFRRIEGMTPGEYRSRAERGEP